MSSEQFVSYFELYWADVTKYAKDAIAFLDNPSAECLHLHGGLKRMIDNGATAVKLFSPFEKASSDQRKAVFVISSPLYGETLRTLLVIIRAGSFRHCTIITSLPESCHVEPLSETEQCFSIIENLMLNAMGNMNYIANIRSIPLFAAMINHQLFLMPSFSNSLSIFKCGFMEINSKRIAENSFKTLSPDFQASIKCFVNSLSSMFEGLKTKIDVFSLGPLSHIIGSELENLSHLQKKKQLPAKVSVVFIDRTLDLAGPLSQSPDTIYDLMLRSLPHLPGHIFDISVSMNEMVSLESNEVFGRPLLAPGCVAQKSNFVETSSLDSILYKKPRESLIDINRKVVEASVKEEISVDPISRVTAEVLQKRVLSFREKPPAMMANIGLLQQALAVVEALNHSTNGETERLLATEKALMQYLTTSGEEVLSHIVRMISEKEKMNFTMEETLIFLAFMYQLFENVNLKNEAVAQASIMEAFFQEDKEVKDLASKFVEEDPDDESILTFVKIFFHVLKRLATLKKGLKKYSNIFMSVNPAFPATYNPLLKQVLEDMFNPSMAEVPDVQFHSAGITDYIKSGFSLFMNVTRPQPRDNPLVILIVLGGITPSEIRLVRDTSSRLKHNKIMLGCTNILTPKEVLKNLCSIVKCLSLDVHHDYV